MRETLDHLATLHQRLRTSSSGGELLARASNFASEMLPFERALMLAVENRHLDAADLPAVRDRASDEWRRTVRAAPIRVLTGSPEADLLRHANGPRTGTGGEGSLAERLGLRTFALGGVVPESRVIAVLVLDREEPAVSPEELALVDCFCQTVGATMELVVMRQRAGEVSAELRQYAGVTRALLAELLDAPATLRPERPASSLFAAVLPGAAAESVAEILSPREIRIAELLVDGRTNREIAEVLVLSPETVKTHVARMLRKLGATNRVEAATQFLRLRQEG